LLSKEGETVRRGDLVFVQGKGIIARIIRFFDRGTFSHVAIVLDDCRVIEADVDTKVAVRRFDANEYNVIEVCDLGLTLKQRREVMYEALAMVGTRYDYIQLLWYGLRKMFGLKGRNRFNNPKYVICSELVFIVLDKAGILYDLDIRESFKNGTDLTPNELYDLVKFVSKK
jgi:uncharacterized protein YycO